MSRDARATAVTELALFAALGAFGLAQWSRLVANPPLGRLFAALAVVCAGAALMRLLAGRDLAGPVKSIAAAVLATATTGAALVVVGLEARLLAPANWAELIDEISRGLAGIEDTTLPYDGADDSIRLTLLLGVPALLGAAAALAFWPARRRTISRALALVPLIALYGFAATLDTPRGELVLGAVLLALCAAWLWLPGYGRRRWMIALATIAGAGAFAVPVSAAIGGERAWWDYEGWDWFGRDSEVAFDWNHSYGPLEWPRDGTTLLEVTSDEPLYWKASVLDRFDGFTWQRAQPEDSLADAELEARDELPGAEALVNHRDWIAPVEFKLAALESEVVVGAGSILSLKGVAGAQLSRDGTLSLLGEPLRSGDEYSLTSYYPRPTSGDLRQAPANYPRKRFEGSTLIGLPARTTVVRPTSSTAGAEVEVVSLFAPAAPVAMPLWGQKRDPRLERKLESSPYGEIHRLARELTADAANPYEAVQAIDRHLRTEYDYTPNVDQATYPLASFVGEDQAGYCQQFAGTMGLMLRMVGIPSRVVSGFAPGTLNADDGVYEVEDFDAHAWVEVYFRGIGWATFDPTPASAPAQSQSNAGDLDAALAGIDASIAASGIGRARSIEAAVEGGIVPGTASGAGPWATIALVIAVMLALAGAAAAFVCWRRGRALRRGLRVEEQLGELRSALERLGWQVSADATLLSLERRFAAAGRTAVVGYAESLRQHRFGSPGAPPPGPEARRALREAVSRGGLRRRLRGLIAIPPGGPAGGGRRA